MSVTTQQAPSGLWTKRQLAQYWAVSERTVDRWTRERRLPADLRVVIGGAVRFRPDAAKLWIAAGCPSPDQTEGAARVH